MLTLALSSSVSACQDLHGRSNPVINPSLVYYFLCVYGQSIVIANHSLAQIPVLATDPINGTLTHNRSNKNWFLVVITLSISDVGRNWGTYPIPGVITG